MAPKKPSTTAEVALVPLKNCLVNLPPSLVALLVNANTVCEIPLSDSSALLSIYMEASTSLTLKIDRAECYCRVTVLPHRGESQWQFRTTILLSGMDGNAE